MEIPAHIQILATIQTGSVYYFEEERLTSTEPHYFIVLNKNPHTEGLLILVVASSQIEKRINAMKRLGFPGDTIVFVSPSEYPPFTKDTVIDCNRVYEKTKQTLIEKLEQNKLRVCTETMADSIVEKLIRGVMASSQISGRIKKMLSNAL